jgi:Type II secretion system protein C
MTNFIFVKAMLGRIQLRCRENGNLPNAALISALAYLVYVGVTTIQTSAPPGVEVTQVLESGHPPQGKVETKQVDFLAIKDWHLFGQPETIAAPNSGQNEIPQETQLQLKLLGVLFRPNQNKTSYAIIETDDHVQKKYRPGDEVPGGITLQSIAKQQVILLRNNQRESLSMDREKTKLLAKT